MSNQVKSFKKYSWIISAIFAIITIVAGLTIDDLTFLPHEYQNIAIAIIGACALIIKIFPENYRVKIAETLILNQITSEDEEQIIEDIDPASEYEDDEEDEC